MVVEERDRGGAQNFKKKRKKTPLRKIQSRSVPFRSGKLAHSTDFRTNITSRLAGCNYPKTTEHRTVIGRNARTPPLAPSYPPRNGWGLNPFTMIIKIYSNLSLFPLSAFEEFYAFPFDCFSSFFTARNRVEAPLNNVFSAAKLLRRWTGTKLCQ